MCGLPTSWFVVCLKCFIVLDDLLFLLANNRLEDAKDRSGSVADSKALDSAMSIRHLIAAAQAKRRQANIQTVPQGNGDSVLVSTTNLHGNSSSPLSRGPDIPSAMDEVDAQGAHLRGSCGSPPAHIGQLASHDQLDSEEPEIKGPGSGHQAAGSTLSGGTEAAVARDAFEGMIETLSRTKESIGRATRLAIDCAKYGIANEVSHGVLNFSYQHLYILTPKKKTRKIDTHLQRTKLKISVYLDFVITFICSMVK